MVAARQRARPSRSQSETQCTRILVLVPIILNHLPGVMPVPGLDPGTGMTLER